MEAFHSLHFLCVYIYAYPSADTISSISAVDAVIAHVVMAVRFSVVAPGFLYTDENWVEFLCKC